MLAFFRITSAQEEDIFIEDSPPKAKTKKIFMERKCLPDNFAEEVMENEFAIEEGTFTIVNVDRLVYLYSQAMEYYEGYDEDKFVRFKD